MPNQLTCPKGHQWDQADDGLDEVRCPICGADSHTQNRIVDMPTGSYAPAPADAGGETLPAPPTTGAGVNIARPKIPGYEIIAELGRGGMGVVYKARQVSLNRTVALKMLLAGVHAGEKDIARFRREAEAVARLQHPNVVQIHEVGAADGTPYFSLEFVDGGSLADRLEGKPWPAEAAARLVEILARAVQAAHRQGIVHRDLKPANVLLTADNTPKIADFGLAKLVGTEKGQTRSGDVLGTPSYMAPEQAGGKGKQVGPAVDVYALGAILYALLTGRPPFQAETPLDTVLKVVSDEPIPPSRIQPKLPLDVETICLKCLQKEPAKRYESADALADDLKRFSAGESIHARPVRAWERAARWVKRRREVALTLLGAAAVIAVVLLLNRPAGSPPGPTDSRSVAGDGRAASDEETALEPLPEDLAMVPGDAVSFGVTHLKDLLNTEGAKRMPKRIAAEFPDWKEAIENWQIAAQQFLGFRPDDIERIIYFGRQREGATTDTVIVITLAKPCDETTLLKVVKLVEPYGVTFHETKLGDKRYYVLDEGPTNLFPQLSGRALTLFNDRMLLMGSSVEALEQLPNRRPTSEARGGLRAALVEVVRNRPHSLSYANMNQALGEIEEEGRKTFTAQVPQVAPLIEAESLTIITSLRSAILAEEGGDLFLFTGRLIYRDESDASAGKVAAEKGVELLLTKGREFLVSMADKRELFEYMPFDPIKAHNEFLLALHGTKIQRIGREVQIDLAVSADLAKVGVGYAKLLYDATGKVAIAADRSESANNLKQLSVSMVRHHDQHGRLPAAAILSKNGKPLLSWRVAVLPYLEHAELFKQFKLDEPWDSEHNIKLLPQMPAILAAPGVESKDPHTTHYRVFVGPDTAFDGIEGLRLAVDFRDGTANTIIIVEAADAVPWTKPDELPYAADKPLPELGGLFPGGFNAAFADGTVRFIPKGAKEDLLRRAIIRNDGQPFKPDDLNP